KASVLGETLIKGMFARVAERRMTQVMGQRADLRQILVQLQGTRDRARKLGHFQRVRQPRPVVIALMKDKDLRLVRETAKGGRMNDAITIAAKRAAPAALRLSIKPAAGSSGISSVICARAEHLHPQCCLAWYR